jgi:hypothetical protein
MALLAKHTSRHLTLFDHISRIFLEWALSKSRLGFNLEIDANESGWYLLIEKADGQLLREWGYLTDFKAKSLVLCLWTNHLTIRI